MCTPPPVLESSTTLTQSNELVCNKKTRASRLNIRHWPPAHPNVDSLSVLDDSGSSDSGSDCGGASFAPADHDEEEDANEKGDPHDQRSDSDSHAAAEGGGARPRAPEPPPSPSAPRAVILAGSLSELPCSMRLGGALIFTDLSSPEAWR